MLNAEQDIKNEKQIFTLVMVLIFTDTLLYGSIVPLILVYTNQFQLSPLFLGVVFAAYALGSLLFCIPLGIMAERYGYRKIFQPAQFSCRSWPWLPALFWRRWFFVWWALPLEWRSRPASR